MSEEYDEVTCVTAGELRAMGLAVPASIPDVGWVPRSAVQITHGRPRLDADGVTLHIESTVTFAVPFRWVEAAVRVEISS